MRGCLYVAHSGASKVLLAFPVSRLSYVTFLLRLRDQQSTWDVELSVKRGKREEEQEAGGGEFSVATGAAGTTVNAPKGHVNWTSEVNFNTCTLPRAAGSRESLRAKAV